MVKHFSHDSKAEELFTIYVDNKVYIKKKLTSVWIYRKRTYITVMIKI